MKHIKNNDKQERVHTLIQRCCINIANTHPLQVNTSYRFIMLLGLFYNIYALILSYITLLQHFTLKYKFVVDYVVPYHLFNTALSLLSLLDNDLNTSKFHTSSTAFSSQ